MRRILICLMALGLAGVAGPESYAQQRRQDRTQDQDREEQRKRNRLERELQSQELPMPELANSGPCPFVKVLYDAARDIEFAGGRQASSAVAYSGEIQGLTATCRYKDGEPITVDINVTFAVGKGPQATANIRPYSYFVAVTDRNRSVLAKEQFSFNADFAKGERLLVFERIASIVIPRANDRVSGENFEVLVGFNVSPAMATFNRNGTRFVVNATGQQTVSASQGQ